MIVRAIGLTSELISPRSRSTQDPSRIARPPGAVATDWLVLSADRWTSLDVLEAVRRNGANGHAMPRHACPLRAAATRPYQFAFIDLVDPPDGLDGLDAVVRSLRLAGTRLLVRGRDGSLEEELWARERGAVAYLPGAISVVGIGRLVGELIRRAGNRGQAR